MVLEFVNGGELYSLIQNELKIAEAHSQPLAAQILAALQSLHQVRYSCVRSEHSCMLKIRPALGGRGLPRPQAGERDDDGFRAHQDLRLRAGQAAGAAHDLPMPAALKR